MTTPVDLAAAAAQYQDACLRYEDHEAGRWSRYDAIVPPF